MCALSHPPSTSLPPACILTNSAKFRQGGANWLEQHVNNLRLTRLPADRDIEATSQPGLITCCCQLAAERSPPDDTVCRTPCIITCDIAGRPLSVGRHALLLVSWPDDHCLTLTLGRPLSVGRHALLLVSWPDDHCLTLTLGRPLSVGLHALLLVSWPDDHCLSDAMHYYLCHGRRPLQASLSGTFAPNSAVIGCAIEGARFSALPSCRPILPQICEPDIRGHSAPYHHLSTEIAATVSRCQRPPCSLR